VIKDSRNLLERPLYSYADSDHLAQLSAGTSRRWLAGYSYRQTDGAAVSRPPVTPHPQIQMEGVSFVDLVELVAIGGLKNMGFSLLRIRRIVANCQELMGVARPLASLRFQTDAREIFVHKDGQLIEVLGKRGRQAWYEVLEPFLQTLDYERKLALACRWWPLGKDIPIVVDPNYGYGFPVIRNSGVRTEIILERFQAGELEEQIAEDFNVDRIDVERALQFELSRVRPAA